MVFLPFFVSAIRSSVLTGPMRPHGAGAEECHNSRDKNALFQAVGPESLRSRETSSSGDSMIF